MEELDHRHLFENAGTPKDYSESIYLIYIELGETNEILKDIISGYSKVLSELKFGYLCEAHIQNIPEIVRSLAANDHAIYQIVRLAKLSA